MCYTTDVVTKCESCGRERTEKTESVRCLKCVKEGMALGQCGSTRERRTTPSGITGYKCFICQKEEDAKKNGR